MAEVYKKIEKRVLELKERESFWKKKYTEIATQNKEIAESNSKQIKSFQQSIRRLEHKVKLIEETAASQNARMEEKLASFEKKTTSVSEIAKNFSSQLEEKEKGMKSLKSEIASMVSGMIASQGKIFDSEIERVDKSARELHEGLEKGIYEKMEATRKLIENYKPPRVSAPAPAPVSINPQMPPPPAPQRPESSRIPFLYEDESLNFGRKAGGKPKLSEDEDDDEDFDDSPDVEDIIKGMNLSFGSAASSMSANANNIAEKLSSIEERVSKIQAGKAEGVERIEDKLQVYRESVNEMKNRMDSIEKVMKDGMVPMMESMSTLVEAVKQMKEKEKAQSRAALQKPSPPKIWEGMGPLGPGKKEKELIKVKQHG